MSSWAGFSDEDLRRLKHKTSSIDEFPRLSYKPGNEAKIKSSGTARSKPAPRDKMGSHAKNLPNPGAEALSPDQMLSKPKTAKPRSAAREKQKNKDTEPIVDQVQENGKVLGGDKHSTTQSEVLPDNNDEPTNKEDLTEEIDEQEGISRELMSLDKFRDKQKEIEEANKMKQKMLYSAIQERQKRTKAEAVKLTKIQKELALLDKITTDDVSLIRDKIEVVSREFMDAQRRYERAEREFIEAKIELQRKLETKENLTDHLYTIIQQNEMRKAKKLAELMKKLQMETQEETEDMPVPHLTILSSTPDPFHHNPDNNTKPTSPVTNAVNDDQSSSTAKPSESETVANASTGEQKDSESTAPTETSDSKSTPEGSSVQDAKSESTQKKPNSAEESSQEQNDTVPNAENPLSQPDDAIKTPVSET